MAVEATHHTLFPPPLILNSDLGGPVVVGSGAYAYNAQQMRFYGIPSAAALPENQFFHQPAVCECLPAKTSVNMSHTIKRSRDYFDQFQASQDFTAALSQKMNGLYQLPPLAGGDVFPQIQQYQYQTDSVISQQTKKMRFEWEERQKLQARLLEASMKKLKEKDEQIQRMTKLNFVLQERVKSLFVENQLWRDLAQTNEATANSLRSDLEQVLHQVGGEERTSDGIPVAEEDDDAESCCSNSFGEDDTDEGNNNFYSERRCRICNDGECSVLFLPCRHLCLCNICGSGSLHLRACPVCDAGVTATLHVNMA